MKLYSIGNRFLGPCAYVIAENKEQALNKWINSKEHENYKHWDWLFIDFNNIKEVKTGIVVKPVL
jgi:hypothetical protein